MYGELEIFLYLFFSIFVKSDLHKNFVRLDYESSGYKNKKYKYTFVFNTFKINIEVKSLECAPEMPDKIDLIKMEHGDLFYKLYFPGMENSILPEDKLGNIDAVVLFSMFIETDLLMDKITEREHMFVFANEDNRKQNEKLFEKLRLKNFVDDTSEKYKNYFNEVYGVYKGINHNGMVSIQRKDLCEIEDWSDYDLFQQKRCKIDLLSNLL